VSTHQFSVSRNALERRHGSGRAGHLRGFFFCCHSTGRPKTGTSLCCLGASCALTAAVRPAAFNDDQPKRISEDHVLHCQVLTITFRQWFVDRAKLAEPIGTNFCIRRHRSEIETVCAKQRSRRGTNAAASIVVTTSDNSDASRQPDASQRRLLQV
jgi:hypothetical protein